MTFTRVALILAILAGVPAAASAAAMQCSIHPGAETSVAALQAQTKLTMDAAKKIALSHYGKTKHVVSDGELEAENGCLVYSFDVRVTGKSGIDEVLVDAGNGKVLERNHETPKQEAAEAAADKAAQIKH